MNLLYEIRAELIDESASLANTLRKARILAEQLSLPELGDWAKSELEGYHNDDVPEYRHLQLPVYGTFAAPMRPKPVVADISSNLPEPLRDNVEGLDVIYNIAVIAEMLASHETESHRTFPVELTGILRQAVQVSDGAVLIEAYQRLPHVFLAGVLDNVKNRLLSFVLDLQEMNATPEALSDGRITHEAINNSFNIHINGDNNFVAAGQNVSQTVSTVQKGDTDSLVAHLRGHNIDEEDLKEIASAVASEPNLHGAGFGSRVAGWIGTMVGKALSGAWRYTGDNAQLMLTEAVNRFYGI